MDKPVIDLAMVVSALSDFLKSKFPDAPVYSNPNQQGTDLPAWFINFVPGSSIKKEVGNRYMRGLHMVLDYVDEYNLVDLYDRYAAAAETLDENLELFAFSHNGGKYLLRTRERNWRMGLDALHYEFKLDVRVSIGEDPSPSMQKIQELNQKIKITAGRDGAKYG